MQTQSTSSKSFPIAYTYLKFSFAVLCSVLFSKIQLCTVSSIDFSLLRNPNFFLQTPNFQVSFWDTHSFFCISTHFLQKGQDRGLSLHHFFNTCSAQLQVFSSKILPLSPPLSVSVSLSFFFPFGFLLPSIHRVWSHIAVVFQDPKDHHVCSISYQNPLTVLPRIFFHRKSCSVLFHTLSFTHVFPTRVPNPCLQ